MSNPYKDIKDKIDLKEFIERKTGSVFKREGQYSATSCMLPGHSDDTDPSFKIQDGSQRFKCFGCGESGDLFDFCTVYGLSYNDAEAMKLIAAEYHIKLDHIQPVSFAIKDLSGLKRDITAYCHELLLSNEPAINFLKTRGFTDAMIKKWKIGISDGKLYQHFRTIYCKKSKDEEKSEPLYELLTQSGISSLSKSGEIFEFIKENILMYPAYVGSQISHWDLREASKDKQYKYQIPSVKREGALFYNQRAIEKMEYWMVEGRDDVIFMEDVAKVSCVGLFGSNLSKEQVAYLMQYIAYEDDVPGGVPKKTINLLMDNDNSGQKAAAKIANSLADYFNINVVTLPNGLDPHEYLLGGGDLNALNSRRISRAPSRVHELNSQYVYSTDESSQHIISDFTLSVEYEIEDISEEKSYMVRLHKDKHSTPLLTLNADHWSSINGMRKWIGTKGGGHFNLYANDIQLMHMKRYMFEKSVTKKIKLVDGYGEVEPGLRVFDNACIYDGKLYKADKDGITWINKGIHEGIKTTSVKSRDSLKFPEKYDTSLELVAKCAHYYNKAMVIPLIGFATYSIFFRQVTEQYSISPILFCTGPSTRGKTLYGNICQALAGAGQYKEIMPNYRATSNALIRIACRCHSIPILLDEFRNNNDREEMARAWFNLSPKLLAQKTNDLQTHSFEFNSPAVMASIQLPSAEDVLNRMLVVDFITFTPKYTDFNFFFDDCYTNNKGAGFMLELVKLKADKSIIKNIEACKQEFALEIKNPRMLLVASIIGGSYITAHKALKLDEILGETSPEAIKQLFVAFAAESDARTKRTNFVSAFFKYIKMIHDDDIGFSRMANVKMYESKWCIELKLDTALHESQAQARKAGRADLDGVTEDELHQYIKHILAGIDCRPYIHEDTTSRRKQVRGVRVDLKQVKDVCGVQFEVKDMENNVDVDIVPF